MSTGNCSACGGLHFGSVDCPYETTVCDVCHKQLIQHKGGYMFCEGGKTEHDPRQTFCTCESCVASRKAIIPDDYPVEQELREICTRLRNCVVKHNLGLGGEQLDQLVISAYEKVERELSTLRGAAEEMESAILGLVNLTDQGREGGMILSRWDQKPITNGDQDVIDRAYILAESAVARYQEVKK